MQLVLTGPRERVLNLRRIALMEDSGLSQSKVDALPKVDGFPVLGRYILCAPLGMGGVGAVYMGYHARLQKRVAIKILRPDLVGQGERAVERFEREAVLSSSLRGDFLIPVTDAGTSQSGSLHYIVMEFVDGENAEERLRRYGGRLSSPEVLAIARSVAKGLEEAHSNSIIHRDLKPSNIMISADGSVRIADLGIARSQTKHNVTLTHADEFVGTPYYMSPEQIHGGELDARTDIYSLGITMYHLLAGTPPFDGETSFAVMQRISTEPLPDLRSINPSVPDVIADLIRDASAQRKEDRIPTAEILAYRIERAIWDTGEVSLADPTASSGRAIKTNEK